MRMLFTMVLAAGVALSVGSAPSALASEKAIQVAKSCINDFSCPMGYRCAKGFGQVKGVCIQEGSLIPEPDRQRALAYLSSTIRLDACTDRSRDRRRAATDHRAVGWEGPLKR